METFNNYIDEFVDWVTGEDTSNEESVQKTRVSSTGGLPVSGGSIRELLQTKLKKPFVYYEDTIAGLYRLFSSESTRDKWIRMNTIGSPDYDPDGSSKLELFNFVRPGDTALTFRDLDSDPRYIMTGDYSVQTSTLAFGVNLSKDQGGGTIEESDSFTVTCTVTDSTGVVHTHVNTYSAVDLRGNKNIQISLYGDLTVGRNEVIIHAKATNSSAYNTITIPIYLISFELSSTFNFATHWDPTKPIDVPVSVKRSDTSLTLKVDVYVDGYLASFASGSSAATWIVNSNETNPTNRFSIANIYDANQTSSDRKVHTLKIEASMYNQNASTIYYSNVLFYDFIVASSTTGIVNKFINTGYSIPYTKVSTEPQTGRVIFQATQYEPFSLRWAYYTDRDTTQQTIDVEWAIRKESNGVYTYTPIATMEGQNKVESETLRFIPDFYATDGSVYLVALNGGSEIEAFPINVAKSSLQVTETGGYNLRLQAYGKTNQSSDRDSWVDLDNNISTVFTGVEYDNNSGWDNNSFVTSGSSSYATINYNPIPSDYDLAGKGKTIEIDFLPEKVVNDGDVIIRIGDVNTGHIDITTNEATLYNGVNHVVHTNYKSNERIKLAFVFNTVSSGDANSNLIYIINNGVLERAATYGTAASYRSASGNIKIGGSDSGVRVYNIRAYDKALTPDEELNNYIYDCTNKAEIINRNDIFTSSVIDYNKVKDKIDTILITGNLDAILNQSYGKDESESTVNFKRECITDATKSFEVTNGMIRKHGQSTLNYPITSMKIWTNKAKENDVQTTITLSETQRAEGLNKNRYIMKTGAIPSNKFVLQANYADSSGTHNGALLRLIQDTWYNATIGGKHILRTAPQLFTSGEILVHNDEDLGEDGSWIEGYGTDAKGSGKTWPQINSKPFPYIIRNAPDSFPCAVFYKNGDEDGYHFLGQYVFMDDKKSDYLYGERSIYHFGGANCNDPFVLKTENTKNGPLGKQDTKENRVWNNKDVLRIEVVLPNTTLSSYMNFDVTDSNGDVHSCTDIKYKPNGDPDKYYWEDYFELIYPDDDDVAEDDAKAGLTKFSPNSNFVSKVTPFITFLKWITDCKQNYNKKTDWWNAGQYSSTQEAFEATAAKHLDMYKLAAYYIFFLRFGLVDSVERNAQLKTYDGQHWHYEPWDMDIALGNTNQGALVLNPPMDRNTMEPGTTTYAFSGRSSTTSNVLWDCLEAWDHWSNIIVPNVAQALYEAGLNYDNIIKMFDEQYAEAWSESMYNKSGMFKYIESGGSDWLPWLQGSRTSHRHWWISTSMNYYDAKWSCGSFNQHRVRLFADKAINPVGTDIVTIKPTSNTFFKIAQQEGSASLGTKEASRTEPAVFDVSTASFSAKDPSYIYGGTFIEEIDLSCFAEKLKVADFSLCYDDVLGAPIKKLNVGLPYEIVSDDEYVGKVSGTQMRLTAYESTAGTDAFANLQVLDITGQSTITTTQTLIADQNRRSLTDLYAIGTGITEFVSSTSGNKFNTIKLPAVTTTTHSDSDPTYTVFNTFSVQNSSWQNIEFWNTSKSDSVEYEKDEEGNIITDDDNNPVIKANVATFTKTRIPYQLQTVQFKGSTASNECAGKFLLDWIESIRLHVVEEHPSYTENQIEEALYEELSGKIFEAENINWGVPGQNISISYKDLARIAKFNNGNNSGGLIKGYIILSDNTELTAVQLNNIVNWFGPSVFTKSSKNSGLVVDQSTEYTRITATGTETINNEVCLREGHTAALNATKFMLSESDQLDYLWSVQVGQNQTSVGINNVNSVKLQVGDDGVYYLVADPNGSYGDYYVTVTATYAGISTSLTIKIIAVILPVDIKINTYTVSGSNARKFYIGQELSNSMEIFKLTAFDENNNNALRDSYVLFAVGQQIEFYPTPIDGETPATVGISTKRYQIPTNNILTTYTNSTELSGQIDTLENRIGDGYLYYTKSATHGGIVLGVEALPQDLTAYTLKVNVITGGKQFTRNLNIILYNDNTILHSAITSLGVQNVLNNLHQELYGNNVDYYYKSDLLSLVGELDFSQNSSSIGSVYATDNNSLLKYLPNITSLNFQNCNNLVGDSLGLNNNGIITFTPMSKLINLNIKNTGISTTLDLSGCPNLESIDFRNTSAGIILPDDSKVSSLQLGNPIRISMKNPLILGNEDTTFSIENNTNVNNISLVGVNKQNVCGYSTFAKIFDL